MKIVAGDIVTFKDGGSKRTGTVVETFIAGRPNGRGIKRQRERARIRFQADDHGWETNRDLDAINVLPQRSLF